MNAELIMDQPPQLQVSPKNYGTTCRTHSLKEITTAAKSHRLYHTFLNQLGHARSFEDVPIMDRVTFFKNMRACFSEPGFLNEKYISPSGGTSSGRVNYVATDIQENNYQRAVFASYLIANEILSSETIAVNMMPSGMMYRASEIFNEYCTRSNATVLPLSEQASDDMICQMAEMCAANTLIGMPSRLVAFAEFVKTSGIKLQFEHVIFAGEAMLPERREYLEKVLNVRRFTGIYGSAETGIWGLQLDYLPANTYFIVPELAHVEINAPDANGYGKVVVTNLVRYKVPILRYDTGDIGRISKLILGGTEFPVLELLQRNGISFKIGNSQFTIKDKLAGCTNFQIHLSFDKAMNKEKARILLVPDGLPDAQEKQEIVETLNELLQAQDNSFISEIQFVRLASLAKSPSSQKPIKLIDSRVAD